MSFNLLMRRLHTYLALVLLPWIVVYGVSSVVFNHDEWLREVLNDGQPDWTKRAEIDFDREVPADADLQALGRDIAKIVQVDGRTGAYRSGPGKITVNVQDSWHNMRIVYDIEQKKLRPEDQRFRWTHFLIRLHERSGYQQPRFMEDAWAVTVDVATGGFLVLIASGLWMWWQLKRVRWTGALTIVAGLVTFAALVALL